MVTRLKNESTLFKQMFFSVFIIGSVLIIGFGSVIYHRTYANVQQTFLQKHREAVNQVKNNLEHKIQMVEYAFSTYSNTQSFKENLQTDYADMQFRDVQNINSQLAYISIMGIEEASYQLINVDKAWTIDQGSLKHLTDEEILAYQTMGNQERYIDWQSGQEHLRMVMTLPVFSQDTQAVGIAEINKQAIAKLVAHQSDSFLNIVNSEGVILFSDGDTIDGQLVGDMISDHLSTGILIGQEQQTYVYTQSEYNQWFYVMRLAPQEVSTIIGSFRISLIGIGCLLIALLAFLAYRIARIATSPINRISEVLKSKKLGEKLEVNQVILEINQILNDNQSLTGEMDRQKPELAALFSLNLFRGCIAEKDIPSKLQQFGYQVSKNDHFRVMLIQIDDLCGRDPIHGDVFLLALQNLVAEIIPANRRLQPIIYKQELQGTLLRSAHEGNQSDMFAYCQAIRKAAKDYLKIKISIGLSDTFQSLQGTREAVKNAEESLRYRLNLGEEVIIFYDDIATRFDKSAAIQYPTDAEGVFLDAMRSGDSSLIKESYAEVVKKITQDNKNPMAIESAFFQLINDIIRLGQLLGADHTSLQKSRNVYQQVLNQNHLYKIEQSIYAELVIPIVETIQIKTDQEIRSLSEKMVLLIHQQYDQELSLDRVAEQLHYNANYLSNVFKREMAVTFADYLQNYRLKIAKKWLEETELTIKEIAARLKYTNSQNFIRFFKKKESVTPGEYRKKFS